MADVQGPMALDPIFTSVWMGFIMVELASFLGAYTGQEHSSSSWADLSTSEILVMLCTIGVAVDNSGK